MLRRTPTSAEAKEPHLQPLSRLIGWLGVSEIDLSRKNSLGIFLKSPRIMARKSPDTLHSTDYRVKIDGYPADYWATMIADLDLCEINLADITSQLPRDTQEDVG